MTLRLGTVLIICDLKLPFNSNYRLSATSLKQLLFPANTTSFYPWLHLNQVLFTHLLFLWGTGKSMPGDTQRNVVHDLVALESIASHKLTGGVFSCSVLHIIGIQLTWSSCPLWVSGFYSIATPTFGIALTHLLLQDVTCVNSVSCFTLFHKIFQQWHL